jgi:transposase
MDLTDEQWSVHQRMFRRRHVCPGEKGGACVGKTKRGKGTKVMAVADGAGLSVAVCVESASPHEVTLVEKLLESRFLRSLRCYKRRWKVERFFAWLQKFRRLVVRYERHAENFLGFLFLGCIIILMRKLL